MPNEELSHPKYRRCQSLGGLTAGRLLHAFHLPKSCHGISLSLPFYREFLRLRKLAIIVSVSGTLKFLTEDVLGAVVIANIAVWGMVPLLVRMKVAQLKTDPNPILLWSQTG